MFFFCFIRVMLFALAEVTTSKASQWSKVCSPTTVCVSWWRAAHRATASDAAVSADESQSRAASSTRTLAFSRSSSSRRARRRSMAWPTDSSRVLVVPSEPASWGSSSTCPRRTTSESTSCDDRSRPRRVSISDWELILATFLSNLIPNRYLLKARRRSSERPRSNAWSRHCACNARDNRSPRRSTEPRRRSRWARSTPSSWPSTWRRSESARGASPSDVRRLANPSRNRNRKPSDRISKQLYCFPPGIRFFPT